jgi:hypothetical protein
MQEARTQEGSDAQAMRETAAELRAYRTRPCLLYISRQVAHADVLALWEALGEARPESLDMIISSPGGDIEAAYLAARELRRRVQALTVYVPFRTKSAATLIALAADELVIGPLGELGPLDAQYKEKQAQDFPLSTSRLLLDTALRELEERAGTCYDTAIHRILAQTKMRPFEACTKAAEFVGTLYGPLLAKLDPVRLAESARGLSLGRAYASRLLRRYRPALTEDDRRLLLDRLVATYPAHSFIVDREEATELGLPVRTPDRKEEELLDRLGLQLIEFGMEEDVIAMAGLSATTIAAAQQVLDRIPERQHPADSPRVRRNREKGPATRRTHGKAAA